MNHHALADDGDVHESARIQVDFLSHKWQEADVWHTWKNMTRHKNELANGVRLENASWRTWWQKRGKLKTVNPQKLNWLKDSDVTWLYGPLHEAPTVKPPKGASLEDKLNIIPPLPKGRKPILKKRTLAEVLVLGLAKTNNLPITPTRAHPDDLKELDIDSRGTKGPEERDRIMLLHTKSDTNLLRPSMGRVQQPSPPSDDEAPTPRRPSFRGSRRSHLSNSNNTSVSPPPTEDGDRAKKRVGFNSYVAQCIAIAPGERDVSEEDEEDDENALSMKAAGPAGVRHRRFSLSSRSNSHSSARSEPLIIAPMAPTLLRGIQGDDEKADVYQPIETPFDGKDSDDESDFGEPYVPIIKVPKTAIVVDEGSGAADLGGDYNVSSKKRKLSAGETSPSNRPRKSLDNDSSSSSLLNSNTVGTTASSISNPTVTVSLAREPSGSSTSNSEDSRGRPLHRTSSGSSLNERSRSRNGNSPMGSRSPDSSRASSSSNARSSEIVATSKLETVTEDDGSAKSAIPQEPIVISMDTAELAAAQTSPASNTLQSPKQDPTTTGFVDKATATARGLIGTLLNGASATGTKRGSL